MIPVASFFVVFVSKVCLINKSPARTHPHNMHTDICTALTHTHTHTHTQALVAILVSAWPSITNPPAMKDVLKIAVRYVGVLVVPGCSRERACVWSFVCGRVYVACACMPARVVASLCNQHLFILFFRATGKRKTTAGAISVAQPPRYLCTPPPPYTHARTHTHTQYIYIYVYVCVCIYIS